MRPSIQPRRPAHQLGRPETGILIPDHRATGEGAPAMSRRAKIVCTLGPATSGPGKITELGAAGLDVARLNMSHGDHDAHRAAYLAVRAASDATGHSVGVLVDLQGPKIRLGRF